MGEEVEDGLETHGGREPASTRKERVWRHGDVHAEKTGSFCGKRERRIKERTELEGRVHGRVCETHRRTQVATDTTGVNSTE